jgi:hypothetical protein
MRSLVLLFAVSFLVVSAELARAVPPDGVEQILPRGRIAAVFDPSFVPADEADLPDDAWMLGVVVDGEARAYSLNLLNRHEVVNDRVGDRPIAAVW